jgi:hypothetical protein
MSNCIDVPMNYQNDAEVEIKDIEYERNSLGFVDTIHGKFVVHIHREHKETELVMNIFRCEKGATGICGENLKEYIEAVDCKRFLNDATGPWHMFAPAIDKRNMCAEITGEYNIKGAKIEGRFFEKYMAIEEGHYRIKVVHHLPGENFDVKNLRACIEMDFDILA